MDYRRRSKALAHSGMCFDTIGYAGQINRCACQPGQSLQPSLAASPGSQLGHTSAQSTGCLPAMFVDPMATTVDPPAAAAMDFGGPIPTPIATHPTRSATTTITVGLQPRSSPRPLPRAPPAARSQQAAKPGHQQPVSRESLLELAQRLQLSGQPFAVLHFDEPGQLRGQATDAFLPRAKRSARQAATVLAPILRGCRRPSTGSIHSNAESRSKARLAARQTLAKRARSTSQDPISPAATTSSQASDTDSLDAERPASSHSSGTPDPDAAGPKMAGQGADGETVNMIRVRVGDEEQVQQFYEDRFKHLQQIPCKSIAKDWIKAIEPKKQGKYPYNGGKDKEGSKKDGPLPNDAGEKTRPPWWPTTGCPHREPDHIHKDQRLLLLMHLLRNLYKPPEKAKAYYEKISAKRLKLSTKKTAEAWQSQGKYQQNEIWLNEIYLMRELEERFLRDECDASTTHSFHPIPEPKREPRKSKNSPERAQTGSAVVKQEGPDGNGLGPNTPQSTTFSMPAAASGISLYPAGVNDMRAMTGPPNLAPQIADSQTGTTGPPEAQSPLHSISAASQAPSSYAFRGAVTNATLDFYPNNNLGPQFSPYQVAPFVGTSLQANAPRPTHPSSPMRKRSASTMDHDLFRPGGSSTSYVAVGPSTERSGVYHDPSYFPAPQPSGYNGRAIHPSRPTHRVPGSATYATLGTGPPRNQNPGSSEALGVRSLSLRAQNAPANVPNPASALAQWTYGTAAHQIQDMQWSPDASRYGAYSPALASPAQTANIDNMMQHVQLQPQIPGTLSYPPPNYAVTTSGYDPYPAG